ncbi:MAG: hypothetical protein ACI9FR_000771 [Cryomorphaceae bacterium]|jgi:hypothetical protein
MPTLEKLNPKLIKFIESQKMFFVASAAPDGLVNVSPKVMDTLNVLSDNRIVWLNLTGSGNETAAHVRQQPRMTLTFCSFDQWPLIVRAYGTAKVVHPRDEEWTTELDQCPNHAGSRQIFDLKIDLVQTSCGTGVPMMKFEKPRVDEDLIPYYEKMGQEGVEKYWLRKNSLSLDGTPTGIVEDKN